MRANEAVEELVEGSLLAQGRWADGSAAQLLQQRTTFGPLTKTATGVDVSRGTDVGQTAAPRRGTGFRVGKRTIRVVGTGDDDAWEREPLPWHRRKTDRLDWKVGALRVGNGNKQRGLDWRMGPCGPMCDGKAGQTVGDDDHR